MSQQLKDEIVSQLDSLSDAEQRRVLEFVHALASASPDSLSGRGLLRFVGLIPADDLALMAKAIEEECERIDASEW
jgi:hypothetical protein